MLIKSIFSFLTLSLFLQVGTANAQFPDMEGATVNQFEVESGEHVAVCLNSGVRDMLPENRGLLLYNVSSFEEKGLVSLEVKHGTGDSKGMVFLQIRFVTQNTRATPSTIQKTFDLAARVNRPPIKWRVPKSKRGELKEVFKEALVEKHSVPFASFKKELYELVAFKSNDLEAIKDLPIKNKSDWQISTRGPKKPAKAIAK